MFVSRLTRTAPVSPVSGVNKNLPKNQDSFKKNNQNLKEARKAMQDAIKSLMKTETLIEKTYLSNSQIIPLKTEIKNIKQSAEIYKKHIQDIEASSKIIELGKA